MTHHIALTTYLVRDYDEAIAWFSAALKFKLFEDTDMGSAKRWVVMGPANEKGARFLLAQAANEDQAAYIGKAAGSRVAFFLHTDDFVVDHNNMTNAGVQFHEQPRHEPYGTVAVFSDLYGNRWDLIQPA
jgi:predicted enzyme related to lactoylglutathione lyase